MFSRVSEQNLNAWFSIVGDLLKTKEVRAMQRIRHHGMTCYDHSLFVSYLSFLWARKRRLDDRSAARAGLWHDLYLYAGHDRSAHPGLQCFDHPIAAWRNAKRLTRLSPKEENIILSHMWPAARFRPRSREALIVNAVDTFCATVELSHLYSRLGLGRKVPSSVFSPALS